MEKVRKIVKGLFVVSCVIFAVYVVKAHLLADHKPPKIFFEEKTITVDAGADDKELLRGVTAKDDCDGDITDSVRIASKSNFIEKGRRKITYAVFDKANHGTSADRMVVYKDYVSPRIYMKKPLRYTVSEAKNVNGMKKNMSAEDCLNGDVSGKIRMSLEEEWYDYEPGEYDMTLQVSNEAGDTCFVPMKAVIIDNSLMESRKYYPALSDYIVYTSVGKELELKDYLTGVLRGNTESYFTDADMSITADNIVISADIDYHTPGVYEVEYSYTSLEGINAVTKLYVVVED